LRELAGAPLSPTSNHSIQFSLQHPHRPQTLLLIHLLDLILGVRYNIAGGISKSVGIDAEGIEVGQEIEVCCSCFLPLPEGYSVVEDRPLPGIILQLPTCPNCEMEVETQIRREAYPPV